MNLTEASKQINNSSVEYNSARQTNHRLGIINTTNNYYADADNLLDSLKQSVVSDASVRKILFNDDVYKKVLSYQNFKQLEAMLYASGKSITIIEDPKSKYSYKKLITIEATDANGNKNVLQSCC